MSARANDGNRDPHRDELLDHEADGIREFDNALPRWWLYGFYFTIVLGIVYMLNYHVLATPLVGKAGMVAEYNAEVAAARAAGTAKAGVPGTAPTLVALTDPASLAAGKTIFEGPDNVCYSCHRPDLGGMIGPNLTDARWLHGCGVEGVVKSIKTGYPVKGMIPFGTGKALTDQQVLQVASYVLSKQGSNPPNPKPIEPDRDVDCK
jgi:cytochrome c oxidase cbb3-type subunit 3